MRRITGSLAAVTCILLIFNAVRAQPEAPACAAAAWSPEVLEFHGDTAAINKRLQQYDPVIALDIRRVFLVIVETDTGAQVSYFERDKDNKEKMNVTTWKTKSAAGFKKELQSSLLSRKGKGCAGVMAQDLLGKEAANELKADKEFTGKAKSSEAFKHVSPGGEDEAKKYKQVTIVVLC